MYETACQLLLSNNVNTFKNRLDRLWANQDLIFDYKSTLTGTGTGVLLTVLILSIFSFSTSYYTWWVLKPQPSPVLLQLCFALLCAVH